MGDPSEPWRPPSYEGDCPPRQASGVEASRSGSGGQGPHIGCQGDHVLLGQPGDDRLHGQGRLAASRMGRETVELPEDVTGRATGQGRACGTGPAGPGRLAMAVTGGAGAAGLGSSTFEALQCRRDRHPRMPGLFPDRSDRCHLVAIDERPEGDTRDARVLGSPEIDRRSTGRAEIVLEYAAQLRHPVKPSRRTGDADLLVWIIGCHAERRPCSPLAGNAVTRDDGGRWPRDLDLELAALTLGYHVCTFRFTLCSGDRRFRPGVKMD